MDRVILILVVVAISAGGGFYAGRSNNAARIAWLEDEVERYAEAAIKHSEQQRKRAAQVMALSKQVSGYELELANGSASACVGDPTYDRRLRKILETGGQPASGD